MLSPKKFDRILAYLLVLGVIFLVSVAMWFFNPGRTERRIYFFPRHYVTGTGAEDRVLPVQPSYEQAVALYVREYLLGPSLNKLFRILPLQTRVKSVFIADNVVYVDLSAKAFERDYESRISFNQGIELLKRGVLYNFPAVKDVVVTIEGREFDPEFSSVDE